MKIHPEIKELIDEAMREGLRFWRKSTPEQIAKQVRARMVAEQKTIMNPTRGIAWRQVYRGCDCCGAFGHYPWCNGRVEIELFTPEPEPKKKTIDGREWYAGHSPWGIIP